MMRSATYRLVANAMVLLAVLLYLKQAELLFREPGAEADLGATFGFVALGFAAAIALMIKTKIFQHWAFWLGLAGVTSIEIFTNWYDVGNHRFVFVYMCLALMFVFLNPDHKRNEVLRLNVLGLFVILMVLAGIQKFMVAGYMDGEFNAFMMANGEYFKPLQGLIGDWDQVVAANRSGLDRFFATNPAEQTEVKLLAPIESLSTFGVVYAWAVVLGEILLPVLFFTPVSQHIKHAALLGFIAVVFLSRQECGFQSMVVLMGLALCPAELKWARATYLGIFAFFLFLITFDLALF